ncbi:hypothetical protein KVV02_003808 [Mortierella alpina]|uniref:Methyltransferase small domain-containing protein n=1 Tax=Mortierella alpina TaxID=64518 RepID=A0A9P8D307_MORAP|nr:hypothetical protein KVV02_003808 [Mortierella alpina]
MVATIATLSTQPNIDRSHWEGSIAKLIKQALSHSEIYTVTINGLDIAIHPNVYSPMYFPESTWYAQQLEGIVYGKTFLEVGVGSGIIALHVARTGSKVYGLDINPDAVAITRKNFEMNGLWGDIRVSDLYAALDPGTKVDYIFWNHPWQISRTVVRELQSEKTLDEGYKALSRYIRDGHTYLNDGGSILIGTSCYADLESLNRIALQHGYGSVVVAAQGESHLADGTCEIYYILRLDM